MIDETLVFSLELAEIPVVLERSGERIRCVLVEMDGSQRDKFLNNMGSRTRIDSKGNVQGIKNFDGLQANLISRCLYRVLDDGNREALTEKEIQQFPSKVQSALFSKAQEMCGLDDEKEKTAKND